MFLQSQLAGKSVFSSSQDWKGRGFSPLMKEALGTLHPPLFFMKEDPSSFNFLSVSPTRSLLRGSFFSSSVAMCFWPLDQVSVGVAQAQSVSMAILFLPLTTRTKPCSPYYSPQEFLTVQYLVPFSTPYPTIEISWTMFLSPVVSSKIPEV